MKADLLFSSGIGKKANLILSGPDPVSIEWYNKRTRPLGADSVDKTSHFFN